MPTTSTAPIVLASTSPYRKKLLSRLGVHFITEAPAVDEEQLKKDFTGAIQDLPQHLALQKAKSVLGKHPDAIVIGSDQMALLGESKLDKPGSIEKSRAQLAHLAGKTHELLTALAVGYNNQWQTCTVTTRLTMKALQPEQIEWYIKTDQPFDCAGSYKIEEHGISLFENIECSDQSAIVGLPLIELSKILTHFGLALPPHQ